MFWHFKVMTDWDQVWEASHQEQWMLHMDSCPGAHVFFHPSLVKAWVDTYLPLRTISPLFVWANHENGNKVFLPLVLWKQNWKNAFMKSIVPAGYADFDYHDPVFLHSPSADELSAFWRELTDTLGRHAQYDEIALDGLHQSCLPQGWAIVYKEPCPFIPIKGLSGIDDYLATRSKKIRYNLRREQKRAQDAAKLSYMEFFGENINMALEELPLLLECHRSRWPRAYKAPRFYENLLREGLNAGVIHFSRLTFDEHPASWRVGFIYKGRYYSYMPTINPEYSEYIPGKIHLLYCINYAIERKCGIYDQMRGDESYKSNWTRDFDFVYNVERRSGAVLAAVKRMLVSLKKIILKAR